MIKEQYTENAKHIYGKLKHAGIPVDNETAKEIDLMASDYCIGRRQLDLIINNAIKKYERNYNFNYLEFILFGIIGTGKEKGIKDKRKNV